MLGKVLKRMLQSLDGGPLRIPESRNLPWILPATALLHKRLYQLKGRCIMFANLRQGFASVVLTTCCSYWWLSSDWWFDEWHVPLGRFVAMGIGTSQHLPLLVAFPCLRLQGSHDASLAFVAKHARQSWTLRLKCIWEDCPLCCKQMQWHLVDLKIALPLKNGLDWSPGSFSFQKSKAYRLLSSLSIPCVIQDVVCVCVFNMRCSKCPNKGWCLFFDFDGVELWWYLADSSPVSENR